MEVILQRLCMIRLMDFIANCKEQQTFKDGANMAYMCKIRSLYSHSVTRTPPLQIHHFTFRHYFRIGSITSNSDIEVMPIKHRMAIFTNSLRCYLIVSRSESLIMS